MGRSVNKVILWTRWQRPVGPHPAHSTIVNLSLATSERYRDIHGDWQEHTECTTWSASSASVRSCANYVRRDRVCISRARCERASGTTADRQRRYRSEIVVTESAFCRLRPMAAAIDVEHYVSDRASRRPSSSEEPEIHAGRSTVLIGAGERALTPKRGLTSNSELPESESVRLVLRAVLRFSLADNTALDSSRESS